MACGQRNKLLWESPIGQETTNHNPTTQRIHYLRTSAGKCKIPFDRDLCFVILPGISISGQPFQFVYNVLSSFIKTPYRHSERDSLITRDDPPQVSKRSIGVSPQQRQRRKHPEIQCSKQRVRDQSFSPKETSNIQKLERTQWLTNPDDSIDSLRLEKPINSTSERSERVTMRIKCCERL